MSCSASSTDYAPRDRRLRSVRLVRLLAHDAGLGAVFPALGVVSVLMVAVIAVLRRVVPRRA